MSHVPRSLQSWVSTIQSVVLEANVFHFIIKNCIRASNRNSQGCSSSSTKTYGKQTKMMLQRNGDNWVRSFSVERAPSLTTLLAYLTVRLNVHGVVKVFACSRPADVVTAIIGAPDVNAFVCPERLLYCRENAVKLIATFERLQAMQNTRP